jgi:hypothetical protein
MGYIARKIGWKYGGDVRIGWFSGVQRAGLVGFWFPSYLTKNRGRLQLYRSLVQPTSTARIRCVIGGWADKLVPM